MNTAATNHQPVVITNAAPAHVQKSFTFVPVGHNAQPGQGSLGHWQTGRRAVGPACMMCGGEQKFAQRGEVAGMWCDRCQFFTPHAETTETEA